MIKDNSKKYLLVVTNKEKEFIKNKSPDKIKQFLVFSENNPHTNDLFKYYKKFIFQLNEKQYQILKLLECDEAYRMTKQELFFKFDLEEFLI